MTIKFMQNKNFCFQEAFLKVASTVVKMNQT